MDQNTALYDQPMMAFCTAAVGMGSGSGTGFGSSSPSGSGRPGSSCSGWGATVVAFRQVRREPEGNDGTHDSTRTRS